MSSDKLYIRRCFELAKLGKGYEKSNPIVGAVIVYKNSIIGEGWHQKYGGPHAEVNAVNSVLPENQKYLPSSTIYVSLEPCFHFGKTPPCVNLVIEKQFKRVVVSCLDINPKVAGQSIQKLKEKGIEVKVGVLEEEGKHLIRRFRTFHQQLRPYIILKWAESRDGFIGQPHNQVWLTGETSKRLVHKWRSEESAIIIGTNTARIDNPRLTNRLYTGQSPLRIVLDRAGVLDTNLHIFDGSVPTICFSEKKRKINKVAVIPIGFDMDLLNNILSVLHGKGIKSLIVEGGASLLQSFINEGLWDEARVFMVNERLHNGVKAPMFMSESFQKVETFTIGNDQLELIYKRE